MTEPKVGIIVVLYQTNNTEFSDLAKQCDSLYLIDNTPGQNLNIAGDKIKYLSLNSNRGIAYAQNVGIKNALFDGCDYVFFLDQDSKIPDNFIYQMVNEYNRIRITRPNLFALGPSLINGRTKQPYIPTFHKEKYESDGFLLKSEIISSGSVVDIKLIEKVGLLNETLFIDYVDNEWYWRAADLGFVSGMTKNVCMTHYIGQQDIRVLKVPLRISSPIRYYYQCRNYLWLRNVPYSSKRWRRNSFIKLFIIPLVFPFRLNNWRKIYKEMRRGIKDGLFCKDKFNFHHK